ncbi:MAG TPA: right-handed parallel beta-helix repeat-containing protein, partial [Firmicutes bacterium]|nr:right-handed parallel beta-helix repeat-containing protein [Bacillota bacterium]
MQVREGVRADDVQLSEYASSEPDTLADEEVLPAYILRRPTGPVTLSNNIIDGASFTGIVLFGVDSSVVVDNNRIENCSNGIAIEKNASPTIRSNVILNNSSAGIVCSNNSNPSIDRTTIIGSATAGIICSNGSSPFITETVIAKNGIGISTTNSSPTIQNSTIAMNDFSGIIAYEGARPRVSRSNVRDNGLAGVDNRSSGDITADRVWWGHIVTDQRPAPVIDAAVRRARGEEIDAAVSGSVTATNPLDGPSVDAPGTPNQAVSLLLASTANFDDPDPITTITNGDTLWIRMVAVDESPYLEDQGVIIIASTSGDPEGTQRVLNESGPNTGTYEGYVIASLTAGDPNIVVEVQNGDQIRVTTGTVTPLTQSVTFVSKPAIISRLRVNGEVRGARLTDPTPTFTWQYVDPENDPQAATQLELSTDPVFSTDPVWRHDETGRLLEYTYDGPPLQRGTTYYLRVRANDSYNWGRWRETSFHMNIAPPTPTPAYPEDGAIITSGSGRPEIAVNNVVDADGDEVSYVFQAFYGEDFANARMQARGGDAPVPGDPNRDVTVWKTVPMLWENSTIWWRVKATDGLEDSDWSTPRSFLLNVQNDPPSPFNMTDPRPDSTVFTIHPRFEWEHTYDPDPDETIEFVLTIARDSLFTNMPRSYTVEPRPEPIQYFQIPQQDSLLDNTYYYWKVVAIEDGEVVLVANEEDSELPEVWKFFVDTGNDPPYFQTIPRVTMQEDTPYRVRVGRYIVDPDNTLDQISVTVRGTQNIAAEVVGDKEILLTPKRDWSGGPETVRLEAQDPLHSIGIGEIIVTVVGVNDPPTLQNIPVQTVAEDTDLRLDLNPFADDIDNRVEELTWRAEYDQTKLQITIERGIATIRGTHDFFGDNVPVRFVVTDPGGLSASTSTTVTVTPVNDA